MCQNSGCYKAQSAPHTGDANCVTEVRCEDCNIKYKNQNKHAGPFTYSYKKEDDEFHKEVKICTACEKETGDFVSIKHEEKNPANCTRAAVCKVCLQEYGSLNPDKHDWGAWTPDTGNKTHTSVCKNNSDHKQTEKHTGGGATCSTFGDCSVCNVHYKNSDVHEGTATTTYTKTSDIEHTPTTTYSGCPHSVTGDPEAHQVTTAATCSEPAYCGICKQFFGNKNPDNHTWVAATCQWAKYCSGCGTMEGEVDLNNHVGEATTTYKKTSDTEHTPTTTYSGCPHSVTGDSEAHTQTSAATCTTAAYCADCDSNYGSTNPDNHVGGTTTTYTKKDDSKHTVAVICKGCTNAVRETTEDHRVGTEATCTQAAVCADCDSSYGEPDPTAHDLVSHGARAASCTQKGWYAYQTCRRCSYSTYRERGALGHDVVTHEAKAASCTEIGWEAYETCSRCDYTTYEEIAALGHDMVLHNPKAASCTEGGWDVYETCSRCDYYVYVPTDALGHDIVKHEAQAPGCVEIGWDAYETCSRCDYTTYVEIAALGHDVVTHEAQAASCTEKGWAAYETCARCDYSTYAEIAALGHDMVLHNPKAASCTEGGWDVYETCARCDHCVYVPTAALGHDYAAKVVKPGCTEQGYTVHTCGRCQDSYRDAYVAALGHWYGEWTPCGDGTNSAVCLRGDGQERAVDCARYGFALTAGEARLELTLCPVCGEVCEIRLLDENGEVLEALSDARLALAEGAAAEALTGYLPTGELVVRMGALEGGEMLMSVAFEASGEATLPTGQVKITLPAALLEGYALALIDGDGAEAALPVEADEAAETVSFVLDFTETETPVRLIRLVAEA